ncbi:MAG: DUF2334 domain-containing protein [Steroidobacteraceae bacterium]
MSEPRFLVRFDDICPRMNWNIWAEIEAVLRRAGVRPILAVVPENRDPHLDVGPSRSGFWDEVRRWQADGWTIGLHGFCHVYESCNAGLLGLNGRSEFAGLPRSVQAAKLDRGLAIFERERVRADCWVAPGHSFDRVTVELLRERGVNVISDGFFRHPVQWHGVTWVPQQLWRFRDRPAGVWTVCFHHNDFKAGDVQRLDAQLRGLGGRLSDLPSVLQSPAPAIGWGDRLRQHAWLNALRLRRVMARAGA